MNIYLKKTVASGTQTLQVVEPEDRTSKLLRKVEIYLDGQHLGEALIGRLETPKQGCTHYVHTGANTPIVAGLSDGSKPLAFGLTASEASHIEQCRNATQADATTRLRQSKKDRLETDPEFAAWSKIEELRKKVGDAYDRLHGDNTSGTGIEHSNLASAEDDLKAAKADYLATFGETGHHYAKEQSEVSEEKARKQREYESSFVARGLD